MFSLPSDFTTEIGSSTTSALGQLAPIGELVIGVLLATLVIGLLISFFRHH
jgi:flagellar biosynthesis protein FliQ